MIANIDKLIEKVKTYPNYLLVLADISGYSMSYVQKMLNGERKLTMDFLHHLLAVSKLIDKQKKRMEEEVAAAVGYESSDSSLPTQAPAV